LIAAADPERRIKGLVNIEGNLTPQDVFISSKAVSADGRGECRLATVGIPVSLSGWARISLRTGPTVLATALRG
jgi:hypothetical protein